MAPQVERGHPRPTAHPRKAVTNLAVRSLRDQVVQAPEARSQPIFTFARVLRDNFLLEIKNSYSLHTAAVAGMYIRTFIIQQ